MESLIDATPQGMQMRKGLDELVANDRISIEMKQQEMSRFRDVVHSDILKMGVPRGFVKNALLLAQYDFLLFAAAEPFLTLPVTAVFSLLPGFARLYAATPALVIPAPDFVDLKFFLFLFGMTSPPLAKPGASIILP